MLNPIYTSEEHKTLINLYLNTCKEFCKDITTKSRYNNYLEVLETIIEYHNNYGSGVKENNFYDWIMIIPTNVSVATNGFFAGVETKRNAASLRSYKIILEQLLVDIVDKIDDFELTNE
jgi:hypothetical protein